MLLDPLVETPLVASSQAAPLAARLFKVVYHPDGSLYVGDLVSLEVLPPPGQDLSGSSVRLTAPGAEGEVISSAGFGRHGIGGRLQATLLWAWDTAGLESGVYDITFAVLPAGPSWTQTVLLHPREQLPDSETSANWAVAESECCRIRYITGTAAERDLAELLEMVDEQAESAARKLDVEPDEPLEITFFPRVLGHGGFARQDLSVSYLDRNYAGNGTLTVLHHELIHALDAQLGGELRPVFLVEGLAVYLTGGHFKPEPLMPRAAALLPPEPECGLAAGQVCALGWYVPLTTLVDHFYMEQHETGYLQAGALVEFMVETWGWQAFSDFYRDIHPAMEAGQEGGSHYQAVDRAVRVHFGLDLAQLEAQFLEALGAEVLTFEHVEDVRLSVNYYDAVRRYQQLLDPSAYFLAAWLPDNAQMRLRGVVADYLRHPSLAENLALETMLVGADASLRKGDFAQVDIIIRAVNAVLDAYPNQGLHAFSSHPMAIDTMALVQAALARGYQPQRIHIEGKTARIWVSTEWASSGPQLSELRAIKQGEDWVFGLTGN
jgi:hypothetical protein